MEMKKWLESVLLPSVHEVKHDVGAVQSELRIVKSDIAHLEKVMLLRFEHVDMRLTNVESQLVSPDRIVHLESKVEALEKRISAVER